MHPQNLSINTKLGLLDFKEPRLMGILNITPDSFYSGSRFTDLDAAISKTAQMLEEGADIIDIGGFSSRPGSILPSIEDERRRLAPVVKELTLQFPHKIFSIDTMRMEIAETMLSLGVSIINDISGGDFDKEMIPFIAGNSVPYVCMHMQGTPYNMQQLAQYEDVVKDVFVWAMNKKKKLSAAGIKDVIIDPGFGFSKTVHHNYQLLNNLSVFRMTDCPVLVGISRKSMLYKVLEVSPEESLNATTAVHMVALMQGANILRVHDIKEAKEVVKIFKRLSDVNSEALS